MAGKAVVAFCIGVRMRGREHPESLKLALALPRWRGAAIDQPDLVPPSGPPAPRSEGDWNRDQRRSHNDGVVSLGNER